MRALGMQPKYIYRMICILYVCIQQAVIRVSARLAQVRSARVSVWIVESITFARKGFIEIIAEWVENDKDL